MTIDKASNKGVLRQNNYVVEEDIRMLLVNMAMNIGHFNINISVKKDKDKQREMMIKKAKQAQRIKEVLEDRNKVLTNYHMHDYMG
jgi:hypothetical protein